MDKQVSGEKEDEYNTHEYQWDLEHQQEDYGTTSYDDNF